MEETIMEKTEIEELKQEALAVIFDYVSGDPKVSKEMCRTAARVLAACSDLQHK